jgi:arylsulfatase A-like enzyme
VFAGKAAADFFHTSVNDPRRPDLFGIVQHGVVYTGGTHKTAEHGGADPEDRNVPVVVSGAGVGHAVVETPVETTQIAPTMLGLLGLNPNALQAVQREGTAILPGS